jgi:hypothetical protein
LFAHRCLVHLLLQISPNLLKVRYFLIGVLSQHCIVLRYRRVNQLLDDHRSPSNDALSSGKKVLPGDVFKDRSLSRALTADDDGGGQVEAADEANVVEKVLDIAEQANVSIRTIHL